MEGGSHVDLSKLIYYFYSNEFSIQFDKIYKIEYTIKKMLNHTESRAINAKASGGDYEWAIGEEADQIVKYQRSLYTEKKLKDLVWWFNNIFGWKAEFKPNLLK